MAYKMTEISDNLRVGITSNGSADIEVAGESVFIRAEDIQELSDYLKRNG